MTEKRNFLLIIPALQCGGAERVMVTLANYWASLGWEIHLLTHEKQGVKPFYPLASSIKLIQINALSLTWYLLPWDFFKRIWCIRRTIKTLKPQGVLSFLDMNNVVTVLASLGLKIPVWIGERTNPQATTISVVKKWLRNSVYKKSTKMIVQTNRIYESLPVGLKNKACVIPNPFLIDKVKINYASCNIVASGRLGFEKGFDILIKAFKKIAEDFPSWTLTIWGEGEERENLESLIRQERLEGQVLLPGKTKSIFQELSKASIFVLSSRFEGMPNALGEAMSMGLAAISTDCPTGPRELISHGKNGLLVPNEHVEELVSALKKLMNDQKLREQLGNKAIKSMKAYDIKTISDQWERVFDGQA